MAGVIQRSFAGGEVSEAISARADVLKRGMAAKLMRNFFAARSGAAMNRAGTKYVATVKNPTQQPDWCETETGFVENLIPFIFNSEQAYCLEFGDQYIRFHQNGEPVIVGPLTAWSGATAYTVGDLVLGSDGVDYYAKLDSTNKDPISEPDYWYALSSNLPAYYDGDGTSILEVPTPYTHGQITKQQVAQSADVLSIAHKKHAPRELQRLSATKWQLIEVNFKPDIDSPGSLEVDVNTGVSVGTTVSYTVTAIRKGTYEESVVGHRTQDVVGTGQWHTDTGDITGGDDDNPIEITAAGHSLETGETCYISAIASSGALDLEIEKALLNRAFVVTDTGVNTFTLDDTEGLFTPAATHTITFHPTWAERTGFRYPNLGTYNIVSWDDGDEDALEYWIYREAYPSKTFGFVGVAKKSPFWDIGQQPDFESTPPQYISRFERTDRHPHTVQYFQQRLCYAQSILEPQTVWMSRSGGFKNFTNRSPLQPDDAVIFDAVGREVNEVRHLIDLEQLCIFTLGAELAARGDEDGVVAPGSINLRAQTYNGARNLQPLVVKGEALFLQALGSKILSHTFDGAKGRYDGEDITLFASHLVDDLAIFDWSYALVPHSLVWATRSDGQFLALTLIREQQTLGWSQHSTWTGAGMSKVLSQCVIPEDNVHILYMVVERVINGLTTRYVEKMVKRCTVWEEA